MRAAVLAAVVVLLGVAAPSSAAEPRALEGVFTLTSDLTITHDRVSGVAFSTILFPGVKRQDHCSVTVTGDEISTVDGISWSCEVRQDNLLSLFWHDAGHECTLDLRASPSTVIIDSNPIFPGEDDAAICYFTESTLANPVVYPTGSKFWFRIMPMRPTGVQALRNNAL